MHAAPRLLVMLLALGSMPSRGEEGGALLLPTSTLPGAALPWIDVDTATQRLVVHSGDAAVERLDYIAIGRAGARAVHYQGDHSTPLGRYRVTRINPHSKFHIFIGLDYPTFSHADLALREKRISLPVYDAVLDALRVGRLPPQNTPLGGAIGIHGVGSGSMDVHRRMNWTQGCIAVTNAEIERLARYAWPGMRVEIR